MIFRSPEAVGVKKNTATHLPACTTNERHTKSSFYSTSTIDEKAWYDDKKKRLFVFHMGCTYSSKARIYKKIMIPSETSQYELSFAIMLTMMMVK